MATVQPRPAKSCTHQRKTACATCSWRVEWRRGGRDGDRESCTFSGEQDALAAARLAEARRHRITAVEVYQAVLGVDADPGQEAPPTVAELAGRWVENRRTAGKLQADTVTDQNRILVRHILPYLGKLPVSQVGPETVAAWVRWMRGRQSTRGGPLDADTIHRAYEVLRTLLYAAVPQWLPDNPATRPSKRGIDLPKTTTYEPVFLHAAELARIETCCDRWIADMVYVTARTGLRLGELLVLQVEDTVTAGNRRRIMVRRALKRDGTIGEPKTRRSRRDVSISTDVAARLAGRVDGKRRRDLVFPAPGGGMWHTSNLRQRYWLPAVAAAQRCDEHPPPQPPKPARGPRRKLRLDEVSTCECPARLHRSPRWHDLRHTHVSLCAEAGWDMLRVSRRVGHEKVSTTMDLYGHLWDVEADDRLDALERLLAFTADEDAAGAEENEDAGHDEDEAA